ncbi:hypothetical protein [Bradyrhizobium sp.]|jgi:hypothetical protein|uniref:hypothetical protein n=1 Tax=Bradyrhizobium sp. TaxID=376 RepID=UPI00391AD23F
MIADSGEDGVAGVEKIYSIFGPHTDLIKRGKVRTPVEFGHKVFLAESAAGLITQYEVLRGNPPDAVHVAFSLQRHRLSFGRAPQLYSSDRGFFSEQNLASCKHAGVKVVCIPQRGGERTSTTEGILEEYGLQGWSALSRWHRGTHLRAVSRPRHEALSRRRTRPFRAVGRRRRARQQSHEDRSTAGASVTPAKSCLIDTTARPGHSKRPRLSTSQADKRRATPNRTDKIGRCELADSGILRHLVPNLSA